MSRLSLIRTVFIAALLQAPLAWSHSVPGSAVELSFDSNVVSAELTLPVTELQVALGRSLTSAGPLSPADSAALNDYVVQRVGVVSVDSQVPWSVTLFGIARGSADQPAGDLVVRLRLQPPPGTSTGRFTLRYDVIAREVPNHVALVSVRSDWDSGVFTTAPKLVGVIRLMNHEVRVDRGAAGWQRGFAGIFQMGLHHIAEGTDHLLFLLVLLLPAPLRREGRIWGGCVGLGAGALHLFRVVTAFTIGHSITLAAGAFGLVFAGRWVEVLIALSIAVSAVNAFRPIFHGRESWVAAGFGLVHGMAFADSIAGLGLDRWHTAQAVLGFNLGIEAMQLAVVLMTMPSLLLLARTRSYSALRIGGASFAGVAALGWLGERALGWDNPFDRLVQLVAGQALWLAGGLALAAALATWNRRPHRPVEQAAAAPSS